LARFRMLAYLLLASCGTLGRCSRNPGVPWNPGWKTLEYSDCLKPLFSHLFSVPATSAFV